MTLGTKLISQDFIRIKCFQMESLNNNNNYPANKRKRSKMLGDMMFEYAILYIACYFNNIAYEYCASLNRIHNKINNINKFSQIFKISNFTCPKATYINNKLLIDSELKTVDNVLVINNNITKISISRSFDDKNIISNLINLYKFPKNINKIATNIINSMKPDVCVCISSAKKRVRGQFYDFYKNAISTFTPNSDERKNNIVFFAINGQNSNSFSNNIKNQIILHVKHLNNNISDSIVYLEESVFIKAMSLCQRVVISPK